MKRASRKSLSRFARGFSLIELLVSLTIAGMVTIGLGASLSEMMRLSYTSQSQILATVIAQEVVERLRATPYLSLPPNGTYNFMVTGGDPNNTVVLLNNAAVFARPLQIDASNLAYLTTGSGNPIPVSKFNGTVSLSLSDAPIWSSGSVANTRTAKVTVSWSDTRTDGTPRTYSLTSVLCRFGLQRDE